MTAKNHRICHEIHRICHEIQAEWGLGHSHILCQRCFVLTGDWFCCPRLPEVSGGLKVRLCKRHYGISAFHLAPRLGDSPQLTLVARICVNFDRNCALCHKSTTLGGNENNNPWNDFRYGGRPEIKSDGS